ncbi:MAG: hypothetical protein AAGA54_00150 [Myxococcota bacterium]
MVLAASMVPVATLTPSVVQAAAPASPEELYDQGRKAYRLGDFQTAVDKWQQAYDATDNGLLLYNISLAYKGLYTITNDIGDLRRSRAILDNFIKVAKADPDIEEDDAAERLAELDKMIAEAEQAEKDNQPPPPVVVAPEEDAPREKMEPDPGRKLRLIGIGTMVGGGAIALTGAALAAVYGIRGREFSSNLARDNDAFLASDCDDPEIAESTGCMQLSNNIDTWRENGQQANVLTVALGAGLGGAGVVALVAGGLVFNEGNKRTKQWERGLSTLRVMPTPRGLTLSGRF